MATITARLMPYRDCCGEPPNKPMNLPDALGARRLSAAARQCRGVDDQALIALRFDPTTLTRETIHTLALQERP